MYTIKSRFCLAALFTLLTCTSNLAQADDTYTLTIINHYDKALTFGGEQNAAEVFPELPKTFTLSPTNQLTTKVVDIQKHGFMRVDDDSKHYAFFGVEVVSNQVKIHGYLGKGIAYSWTTDVLTFCTPDDFKKKGMCE